MISKFTETVYRSGIEFLFGDPTPANVDEVGGTPNPLGILEGTDHLYYVRSCYTCGQPQRLLHSGWVHDSGFYVCSSAVHVRTSMCRYCHQIVEPTVNGWIHATGNYRCGTVGLFEYDYRTYGFADAMTSYVE